jgi:hypothetical protein
VIKLLENNSASTSYVGFIFAKTFLLLPSHINEEAKLFRRRNLSYSFLKASAVNTNNASRNFVLNFSLATIYYLGELFEISHFVESCLKSTFKKEN